MALRELWVPSEVMGYLKSIVEAHPGLAAVHAGRANAATQTVRAVLLTTGAQARQLDALLRDLATELPIECAC